MSVLKTFTIQDVRLWGACYDPIKYAPANWQGTALDVLNMTAVPPFDRLWVVLHSRAICPSVLIPFKEWSAQEIITKAKIPGFKFPNDMAVGDCDRYMQGKIDWVKLDKLWDQADRNEQIEKLKSLLIAAEAQK